MPSDVQIAALAAFIDRLCDIVFTKIRNAGMKCCSYVLDRFCFTHGDQTNVTRSPICRVCGGEYSASDL